jgi:hypothetical protein
MKMEVEPVFRRGKGDPLLRLFVDKYNLNLLTIPREKAEVGDLYVHDGRRVSTPGSLTYFLEPQIEISPVYVGEGMADVTGEITNSISANTVLEFLENFLVAMGAGSITPQIRINYLAKGVKTTKFHFGQSTRDWIDPMLLGSKLMKHKIITGHALYNKAYRYYLVTAVVRSSSISIIAEDETAKTVNVDLDALEIAKASAGISATKSNEGEITFTGRKSLAFGVELYELKYDEKNKTLQLALPSGGIQVRGRAGPLLLPNPVFIGATEDNTFMTYE